MQDRTRNVVRYGAALVLPLVGLWLLNLAAFHSWASWGPPSPDPERHQRWSRVFGLASVWAFAALPMLLWLLRTRPVTWDEAPSRFGSLEKSLRARGTWLLLLVALVLPVRFLVVFGHDAWVISVDDACYEAARQQAELEGHSSNWDSRAARSECHIDGDKFLVSTRVWSEDPLLMQMVVAIGAGWVLSEGPLWLTACVPLFALLAVRGIRRAFTARGRPVEPPKP